MMKSLRPNQEHEHRPHCPTEQWQDHIQDCLDIARQMRQLQVFSRDFFEAELTKRHPHPLLQHSS